MKINPFKISVLGICEYCGNYYVKNHHSRKFCSDKCFREHRKDYKAKWKRDNYVRADLGSSEIGATPNSDFEKEEKIVRNELKRFKLR